MLLLLILPNNDFNSIARAFPSLVAYGFRHAQHMKWLTVPDKRARIRNTIESRLYGHLPCGGEFLLGIIWKKHISPSAITRFDFRLEFVFLHCSDFLTARPWSLGIKPLSLVARYPGDY